jgi:hypothetical protein
MSTSLTNLKAELKDLLERYDATIQFECADCSDLHGVYDAKLQVTVRESKKSWKETVVIETAGYTMSALDLEE